jgi:hypothetical protein
VSQYARVLRSPAGGTLQQIQLSELTPQAFRPALDAALM